MLSKEECENALFGICSSTAKAEYRKVFYELIKEHFEPKPYKFEDLKDGIWAWDDVFKEVCYIASIINRKRMYVEYLESHCAIQPYRIMQFEENRFYPVQKANGEKENE